MKPTQTEARTPEWLLERIALGELPASQLAHARGRLLAEPDGASRLAALEAEGQALLARHRPEAVVAEARRRAHLAGVREAQPKRRAAIPWLGLTLAAAVGLLLVLTADRGQAPGADMGTEVAVLGDGARSKGGGPRLLVHRKGAGARPQLLEDSATVKAGDVLQLSYQAEGRSYGAILSLDGRGTVTDHLPESGGMSVDLETHGTVTLPDAYALDDAPAFERFYFVAASAPFALGPVREALQQAAASPGATPSLPSGLDVHTILLHKPNP